RHLLRAGAVATIPSAEKPSYNLAQAVVIFAYEILVAGGTTAPSPAPAEPLADERLISLLRERARALLLAAGFLNPQQPDLVLEELVSPLRRAHPTRREAELLLAAIAQLERTRVP